MKKLFANKKSATFFFIILFLFSLMSFWKVLFFGMWVDDTHLIWSSLYNVSASYWYYNHPGLPLEFLLLSHIFGDNYVWWQIVNILIKTTNAFLVGLFLFRVSNSKKAGITGAVFFAISYAGLEVVNSPIMNIAGIAAIPILLFFYYLISFFKTKKHAKKSIFFLLVAFVLDPGRVVSVILIVPLFFFLFSSKKIKIQIRSVIGFIVLFVLLATIFIFWFITFEPNAQVTQGVVGLFTQTAKYVGKLNRIGNLFAAVGNLFIGLLYSMKQDFQDTGYYARVFGAAGLTVFFIGICSLVLYIKSKRKFFGIVGLFVLWTFIFYLPNWFSEPRAPMAGAHRYLFLSSIGFVCLVAYIIGCIKNKWLFVATSILFIGLNVYKANTILSWQNSYRSQKALDSMWHQIDKDVPKNEKRDIFMFTGQQPWLSQSIQLFGSERFMLIRNYSNIADGPLLLNDVARISAYICQKKNPYLLSHVYAWEVRSPGILVNKTESIRSVLQSACP